MLQIKVVHQYQEFAKVGPFILLRIYMSFDVLKNVFVHMRVVASPNAQRTIIAHFEDANIVKVGFQRFAYLNVSRTDKCFSE